MLIDTHCHLDFAEFSADRDEVLKRAQAAGVEYIINVASSLENSRAAVSLSNEYISVFSSVGIHPHDAKDFSEAALAEISELADNKRVVAIGEVGLDFYRNLSESYVQEEVFRKFINLAEDKNLPLIIHSRAADEDTLRVIKEERFKNMRAVVHCFSGSGQFLESCLELGFYISYTCNITYKKAHDLCELVKSTPLDKLMLETDAPYLSPEGFRGRRNEPMHIKLLAEKIAEIKEITFKEVADKTSENAKALFKLKI